MRLGRVSAMIISRDSVDSKGFLRSETAKKFIEGNFTAIGFAPYKYYWADIIGSKVLVTKEKV